MATAEGQLYIVGACIRSQTCKLSSCGMRQTSECVFKESPVGPVDSVPLPCKNTAITNCNNVAGMAVAQSWSLLTLLGSLTELESKSSSTWRGSPALLIRPFRPVADSTREETPPMSFQMVIAHSSITGNTIWDRKTFVVGHAWAGSAVLLCVLNQRRSASGRKLDSQRSAVSKQTGKGNWGEQQCVDSVTESFWRRLAPTMGPPKNFAEHADCLTLGERGPREISG